MQSFPLRRRKKVHIYNNNRSSAHQTVWSGTEYPPGVLARGNNFMVVKPLFTSSQGHAIWDGDLIINWDLAGYHGEAFGTQSSSSMLSV